MIIVFILGYVLIGILIQLVVRMAISEETMKLGYTAVDDIIFKNVTDKDELAVDCMTGMDDETEREFNDVMYKPQWVAINILCWPINIGFVIVYIIKVMKVLK